MTFLTFKSESSVERAMFMFASSTFVVICICFVQGVEGTGKQWSADDRISDLLFRYGYRGIPIHDFADRYICNSENRHFYFLLKTKFCEMSMSDLNVYRFLLKLCKDQSKHEKSTVLDFLVSTFLDIDRDGQITRYENFVLEQFED
ncbi:uncharacterized protein LOC128550248 [Mercenaria mercenaria]|uniref:uncharacterized protein LOC128550248 n=1 Tax=Mercenaria mercenaria TaxID=6596 RepID=UPI00234E7A58|nr:uncharacterized protein LOC128550248 [Mercenaria mercenaria]